MKMQMSDLMVMIDTLHGSLGINADRLGLFTYTAETREAVLDQMNRQLEAMGLEVSIVDSAESD